MTRYGDYDLSISKTQRKRSDLSRRANIINNSSASLYLSIHLNSLSDKKWSGAQVFYVEANPNNKIIANVLQEQLKQDLKTERTEKKIDNQYMYKRIKVPGVLVEVGFISNDEERNLLKQENYQNKISLSLKEGIINYYSSL